MHLFGVVLLVGNVIVTLVWKLGADRTGEPSVIAFGQRLVTLTDWWFTLGGVVLILIGGFGAAWVTTHRPSLRIQPWQLKMASSRSARANR